MTEKALIIKGPVGDLRELLKIAVVEGTVKIPRQISLKKAATIILISVLLTATGSYYAFATAPTSTFTISSGIYPGAPSYTIWKEGNYYFAKNSNGKIEFSGTDASQVIQSALDALSDGGRVLIKAGEYIIKSTLTLPPKTILEGEGAATILKLDSNVNADLIQNKNRDIYVDYDTNDFIYIRNLQLHGNFEENTAGSCINLKNTCYCKIENCWIRGAKVYGIYLDTKVGELEILNCFILGNRAGGIYGDVSDVKITDSYVSHNKGVGITIQGNLWRLTNVVVDFSDSHGIYINGSENLLVNIRSEYNEGDGIRFDSSASGNSLIGSTIIENTGYGLYVIGWGNRIISNRLRNNAAGQAYFEGDALAHTVMEFNYGYITENSGTATIANGEWLPHGLVGTPTVVTVTTLTPTYDGVPVVVGVASKNATHIQISAYWTNGTAITDDAIDVSWYAKYKP